MIRKAFIIRVKEGMAAEYERRHNPIWEELEEEIRSHGICRYSIYLHPASRYLFCYLEVSDPARLALLSESAICRKWWEYMTEVLEVESAGAKKGWEEELLEVFHQP